MDSDPVGTEPCVSLDGFLEDDVVWGDTVVLHLSPRGLHGGDITHGEIVPHKHRVRWCSGRYPAGLHDPHDVQSRREILRARVEDTVD